jgi:hypothetical protein
MLSVFGIGAPKAMESLYDRSHGYNHFQRSHNSLRSDRVLSFSENDCTHKRVLIDHKGSSWLCFKTERFFYLIEVLT